MEQQKIQLTHPTGKKAISMNVEKYEVLKKAVLNRLRKGTSTHTEMLQAVTEDFAKNKTSFEGSVEWHMEWVKLDLEARKEIKRIGNTSPIQFELT